MAATGFGDEARARLYRIVDAAGQSLSYNGGSDLRACLKTWPEVTGTLGYAVLM